MDVETAFLHSPVDEVIYVRQAPGFVVAGQERHVYKLLKSLYGLKQSPRNWNKTLSGYLLELGLLQSTYDDCLFYYFTKDGRMALVCIYVDDLILTGDATEVLTFIIDSLKTRFVMKDLGEVQQVLGISVERDRVNGTMCLHQALYIKQMLEDYDLTSFSASL
jgi:hypothetical protein